MYLLSASALIMGLPNRQGSPALVQSLEGTQPPRMRPSCLSRPLRFVLVLSLLSRIPASVCSNLQEYDHCRTPLLFDCGKEQLSVTYPFTAADRKGYCGIGEHYKLTCKDEVPVIEISGRSYRVDRIDYEAGVLRVADHELETQRCPLPDENANLDWSLFEYTGDDVNVTLHHNCTPFGPESTPFLHEIPCLALNGRPSYITLADLPYPLSIDMERSCSSAIVVAVLGRAAAEYLNVSGPARFGEAVKQGFDVWWAAGNYSWCKDCLSSGGACGYNSSNPQPEICFCPHNASTSSCPPPKGTNKRNRKIAIGVGAGVGGFLLASALCLLLYRRKKMRARTGSSTLLFRTAPSEPSSQRDPEMGSSSTHYSTNLFEYDELSEATNGFSDANELGDGGFGTVYKGKLRDGRIVAVKRLYENNYKRVDQFKNEVGILNRLRHQNLVTLYGCTSRHSRELLLVYEYVPNGTVADHLHGHRASEGELTWPIRLNIAMETATALAYLHKVEPQIIHRDVKTNNILLDNGFHVKVADFGLSRLFPVDATHVSTAPQGTPGYVDPEYHQCYQLTDKSDVYSFGVVLVELISSKPAVDITRHRHEINLANMAINKIQNGALHELVDPALEFETDWVARRMIKLVAELAFRCLQAEKEMRPSMEDVVEVLQGIHDCQDEAERSGDMDHGAPDDTSLLKNNAPVSPDSVMDKWASRTTTPNTSA